MKVAESVKVDIGDWERMVAFDYIKVNQSKFSVETGFVGWSETKFR